jgi:hypothetical protein
MKNNTRSEIVIEMKHIDHGNALRWAVDVFKKIAGEGGDVELLIRQNGKLHPCGKIGHDVSIRKVSHTIYA